MKKLLLPLVAAVIILTGCSEAEAPPAPAPTQEQVTPEPTPEPELTSDQIDTVYIEAISSQEPGFRQEPARQSAIDLAAEICNALDRGATFDQIAEVAIQNFDPELAGFIIGASVTAYCPEHDAAMQEWIGNNA